MVTTCVIIGCRNRSNKGEKRSFHKVPKIIVSHGEQTKLLSTRRREAWVSAICRKNWVPSEYSRICSDHFISGSPSALYDKSNPDWVPSLKMGCTGTGKRPAKISNSCNMKNVKSKKQKSDSIWIGDMLQKWKQIKKAVSLRTNRNMALFLIELYFRSDQSLVDAILLEMRLGTSNKLSTTTLSSTKGSFSNPSEDTENFIQMEDWSEQTLNKSTSPSLLQDGILHTMTDSERCEQYLVIKQEQPESVIEFIEDTDMGSNENKDCVNFSSERITSASLSGSRITNSSMESDSEEFLRDVVIKQESEESSVEDTTKGKNIIDNENCVQRLRSEITNSGDFTKSDGIVVGSQVKLEHPDLSVNVITEMDGAETIVSDESCSGTQSSGQLLHKASIPLKRKRVDLTLPEKFLARTSTMGATSEKLMQDSYNYMFERSESAGTQGGLEEIKISNLKMEKEDCEPYVVIKQEPEDSFD